MPATDLDLDLFDFWSPDDSVTVDELLATLFERFAPSSAGSETGPHAGANHASDAPTPPQDHPESLADLRAAFGAPDTEEDSALLLALNDWLAGRDAPDTDGTTRLFPNLTAGVFADDTPEQEQADDTSAEAPDSNQTPEDDASETVDAFVFHPVEELNDLLEWLSDHHPSMHWSYGVHGSDHSGPSANVDHAVVDQSALDDLLEDVLANMGSAPSNLGDDIA